MSRQKSSALEGTPKPTSAPVEKGAFIRCLLALILLAASGTILNMTIYASMASFFAVGREIATFANCFAFIMLAIVTLRKPSMLSGRMVTLAAAIAVVIGVVCMGLGVTLQNAPLVLVGILCRAFASVWVTGLFCVALSTITSSKSVLVVAAGGTVLSSFVSFALPFGCPTFIACVVFAACMLIPMVLLWGIAKPSLSVIRQGGGRALQDFKEFDSSVPLLLCMFLVSVASGFAIAFNQQDGAPLITVASDVVVALAFIAVLFDKSQNSEDRLFSLSVLLIVGGFLVAPFEIASTNGLANVLLFAGRDCFYLLLWILLAFVGRRNLFMLLPVVGFVRAASSLGTNVGAVAGHITNDVSLTNPDLAGIFASIMLFVFVAFLWLGFRQFSFTNAVSEMRLITPPEIEGITMRIEDVCRVLGEQHGLTPRETEILVLLAKGRDGRFIADKYVLSYLTVKTHIKHIYAKLGVHSRQELIDLTDKAASSQADHAKREEADN